MELHGIRFHHESVMRMLPFVSICTAFLLYILVRRLSYSGFCRSVRKLHIRWTLCGTVACMSMMVALAGPFRVKNDILHEQIFAKIAIGLDDSPSMGAADISSTDKEALRRMGLRGTRLGLCLGNIETAFSQMRGVEVFLFTFTGSTDIRTGDWIRIAPESYRAFKSLLYDIEPLSRGAGTDISRVFEEAHQTLKNEPSFFFLCSDGGKAGSNVSDFVMQTILKKFIHGPRNEQRIPIYTLGVGTEGTPAAIPLFLPDGKIEGFMREFSNGNTVFTEYDSGLLRQIALMSGGVFMQAQGIYTGRELLRAAILTGLRNNQRVAVENPEDISVPFIAFALVSFAIASGCFSFLRIFRRTK